MVAGTIRIEKKTRPIEILSKNKKMSKNDYSLIYSYFVGVITNYAFCVGYIQPRDGAYKFRVDVLTDFLAPSLLNLFGIYAHFFDKSQHHFSCKK